MNTIEKQELINSLQNELKKRLQSLQEVQKEIDLKKEIVEHQQILLKEKLQYLKASFLCL